jgi:hypothetical protein
MMILLAVLGLGGCDIANDLWRRWISGKPEVLNSGIVSGIGVQSAFWIDNERVILMGIQEGSYQDQSVAVDSGQQERIDGGIYIWNVAEDTLETFRDDVAVKGMCYADGRILWTAEGREQISEKKVRYVYRAGPLEGPLERHERIEGIKDAEEWQINGFECEYMRIPEVVAPKDSWEPLKEEHGYLYMRTPVRDHNVRFYSEPSDEWVELGDEFSANARKYDPIWSPYQGAYFFRSAGGPSTKAEARRGGGCWHGWWLYPEGRLEDACIPAGVWSDYRHAKLAPYRDGYMFVIHATSDVAGVYVSDRNDGYKLIGGYGKRPVVSPDGCRAVFTHNWGEYYPPTDSEDPYMFKAVTLCQGQDKGED